MTWQKKHDIILNWIDSCKTYEQLKNLLMFIKKQDFDKRDLVWFIGLKAQQIEANLIVDTIHKIVKSVGV